MLFSLPPGTKMFQFPGFASSIRGCRAVCAAGCPIRKSAGRRSFAPYRGLSQLITSFIACESQGIRRVPLLTFAILATDTTGRSYKEMTDAPGQGMSYSLYLPDAVCSTTGMLVNFTVARVQYVNERNHIYNHRRRKGRKSQAMPEGGRHRPRQESFQKNRASPERRCSSRTFRYGYLVTT